MNSNLPSTKSDIKSPPIMGRRKAVNISSIDVVKTSTLSADQLLPLVIEPNLGNADLAEWAKSNLARIEESLLKHGAILFRGFNLVTPADFERVALNIYGELYGEYGDLPRAGASDKIYASTPYPNDKMILYHNESSHLHEWPLKISFFCVQAAKEGGCTPLLDCRGVLKLLDAGVVESFRKKGVMYVRNFHEGFDVSWQRFFQTEDKAAVEEACRQSYATCEWTGQNRLRVRQVCKAVHTHPRTGEETFFNQVQLHHVACLDADVRRSLRQLFAEEDLPRHAYFGDGSPISDEIMQHIGETYEKAAVRFQWQSGDMALLDNMLTAHARDPFSGPRKIVVAMGQMMGSSGPVR
ncbi:MAG TPA: TauD/TfdA family dioxygenase [Planctomycetota bacterium]|nr:TauD/TfdA family dioxygenase [Planctomycetota bacterium]